MADVMHTNRPAEREVYVETVETTTADGRDRTRYHPAALARVSWGALIAGLITAMVLQVLFAVLGLAIGFSTLAAGVEGDAGTWSTTAGVYWVVTGLISLFFGGWVAGRCAGIPSHTDGASHGFITWGLATVVGIALLGTALGSLIGGAMTAFNVELQASADGTGQNGVLSDLSRTAEEFVREGGQAADEMTQDVTGEDVAQATEQTAEALTPAAWWTFVALLLGAAAATAGGWLGTPRHITAAPVATNRPTR